MGMIINPYISGERDPFFANVVFLSHNETSAFADVIGHTRTTTGVPTCVPGEAGFGNCIDFGDPSAGWVQYANSAASLDLGTGDYTIEFRVNVRAQRTEVYLDLSGGAVGINAPLIYQIGGTGKLSLYSNGTDAWCISDSNLAITTWLPIALTCASGTTRMFIQGGLQSVTTSTSLNYTGATLSLGATTAGPGGTPCTALMDEIRITKGVARYASTYTPRTLPFPNQ